MATLGHGGTDTEVESLLTSVSNALADQADKSAFAVGGQISIPDLATPGPELPENSPVIVRWDSGKINHCRKASLPVVANDAASQEAFASLLKDCEPATYGVGSKEVLDETYRKAGKMNAPRFSTNFNPYEHGVMDVVSQALVHANHRGIKAELYNLNIYSGPSGKFKPHVDTPRSGDQMGSLVVCLPHPHQGGQLAVRHSGREVTFNWASDKASALQWAAFFSDCEHEVLEVTGGHRLTLTYNLYWTSYGPASMADSLNILEPESLHFFSALQKLLECPEFLPKGGLLGFTCTHAYPHTSYAAANTLHHTLKGIDMLVFQALKRLTVSVKVTHALDDYLYREGRGYEDSDDEKANREGQPPYATAATLGKSIRGPIGLDGLDEDDGYPDPEELQYYSEVVGGVRWSQEDAYVREPVTWLNNSPGKSSPQEFAVAFLVYGNQPGMNYYYSSAVIIADFRSQERN